MSMKFNTVELRDALQWVNSHIDPKAPAVENTAVIIDPSVDGILTLAGWDGAQEALARVSVTGDPLEEIIAIHSESLLSVVRNAPADTITMTLGEKEVRLQSGTAKFKLQLMADPSRATMGDPKNRASVADARATMSTDAFKVAVSAVAPLASDDDTAPQLTGVNIAIKDGKITFVAADRRVLGLATLPITSEDNLELVVPARTLRTVAKDLPAGETLSFRWDGDNPRRLSLTTSARAVSILPIVGFPNYQAALANNTDTTVKVQSKQLSQVLGRAANAMAGSADIFKFEAPTEEEIGGEVTITAAGRTITHAEDLDAEVGGAPAKVGLSLKELNAALRSVGGDEVTIALNSKRAVVTSNSNMEVTVVLAIQAA